MQAFLSTIDDLSAYMNRTCFTGISSREFMFAAYPPGARYARHLDDFQNKNARKFSVITYLNRGWNGDGGRAALANGDGNGNGDGDGNGGGNGDRNGGGNGNGDRNGGGNGNGGELILYGASGVESVAPTFGTTVIFPSAELEHEVLPARRERYSVSGWLR
jgi:SM-20-related protein